jgi:hypothetical protein
MTGPDEQQGKEDELELDPEAVRDLEPDEGDADEVRGGAPGSLVGCISVWPACKD